MAFIKRAQRYFAALYPNPSPYKARINLYCDEGYKLYILFQREPLPHNSYNAGRKTGVAFAELDQYPNYIDLVRNERPVSVTFNPDVDPPIFVVHASEPVGEGEI